MLLMIPWVVLGLVCFVCYGTVLLFMWDQYRFKLIAFAAVTLAAALLIHPYFMVVVVFAPYVYWAVRFGGS